MIRSFTFSIFTDNSPGVLHRITSIFTRCKINVESLTVSETEKKGISRFTIVINTDPDLVYKIAKAIKRIIEVIDVAVSENQDILYTEVAFIRVGCSSAQQRAQIDDFALRHGAIIRYADNTSAVVEKTGTEDDINSLQLLLEQFGIREFIRSGRIAVLKQPQRDGVHSIDEM